MDCRKVEDLQDLRVRLSEAKLIASKTCASYPHERVVELERMIEENPVQRAARWVSELSEKAAAEKAARFAVPPVGGRYHCRDCGVGTNCKDRICICCSCM
jgi:hypothetical protein